MGKVGDGLETGMRLNYFVVKGGGSRRGEGTQHSSTTELQIGSWIVGINITSHDGTLPLFEKINPLSLYS